MITRKRALRPVEQEWVTVVRSCADCFDCGQPRGPQSLSGVCYHIEGAHKHIPNVWKVPKWCPLGNGKK